MSYVPYVIGTSPTPTGRIIDGRVVYVAAHQQVGAMASGTTRGSDLGLTPVAVTRMWGGCINSSIYLPVTSRVTLATNAGTWTTVVDLNTAQHRIRSTVGGTMSAADGIVVAEFVT